MVLIIKDNDGTACHAIGILNGYIYDSNCTNVMQVTEHNLDLLSGTKFNGVYRGRQWCICKKYSKQRNHNKERKRNKRGKRRKNNE